MKFPKRHIISVFLMVFTISLGAQPNRANYFIEGSTFGHQSNPSFIPERNYFSMPGIGNFSFTVLGNVGLSDFIYPYDDPNNRYNLTTFLSPTVDRELFLNSINQSNLLELNLDVTPFSFGFYKWGGYNTVDAEIRSNTGVHIPYEMFNFLKTGAESLDGSSYKIENMRIISNSYSDISLGHARKVGTNFTLGSKLKLIVGIANVDANINHLNITLSQEKIEIQSDVSLQASLKGASFVTEHSDTGKRITNFEMKSPGIGGFGLGFDVGATCKLLDNTLVLSASAMDLGMILWSNTLQGRTIGDPFIFSGFDQLKLGSDDSEDPKSIGKQIESISDDVTNLSILYDQGESGSRTTNLSTTLNVGAKYLMPFYESISLGILSSTRFNSPFTMTAARLYANISPLNWVDFSVNYGISNYGQTLGWLINLHPKGLNLYLGSDHTPTKVTPRFIPIDKFKANIYFGLNFTFGEASF